MMSMEHMGPRAAAYVLLIGTNDIGLNWCAPRRVVDSIIEIAGYIRTHSSKASSDKRPAVFIHGLLPRSFHPDGLLHRGGKRPMGTFPPVWKEMLGINAELRDYCESPAGEGIEYIDAGDIFFERSPNNNGGNATGDDAQLKIDKKLMGDYLHPTARGYDLWLKRISDQIAARL